MWSKDLQVIERFREKNVAAVDTMGCTALASKAEGEKVRRFQCLVSLMLSSQTRDQINAQVMKKWIAEGLRLEKLLEMSKEQVMEMIKPVGFYRKKAIYLKKAAVMIQEEFVGDVPKSIKGLCSLPGVGHKMGYLALQVCWGIVDGIGVDTHVHRIANRLGWIETKTPEKSRLALQELLPKEHWKSINPLLVGFGQLMCLPRNPKCKECPVLTCPSRNIDF